MRASRLLVLASFLALVGALVAPSVAHAQQPIGEWDTSTEGTDDFPSAEGTTAYLEDVRTGSHSSGDDHPPFDRIVLEFESNNNDNNDNNADPSWRVTYVDPPIREDATGRQIEIEGNAFLELRLEPASAVDLSEDEVRETYDGPTRIAIDGHAALEAVMIGDHHGSLAWVVGVTHEAPFAATLLTDPLRLVVDVVEERDFVFDIEQYQSNLNLWFRFVTENDRGPLVVDGSFVSDTRDATRTFQRSQGLPVTGEADAQTRATLEVALNRRIATPFTQRELEWPLRVPTWFWEWALWYLGHGEYAGDARNPDLRPAVAPLPIPDWAWRRLGPYLERDLEARAELLVRQRIQEVFAPVDELTVTLRSERDPFWILVVGSHEGQQGAFAAWLRMREGRWVPWTITRLADDQPNLRPTGAPCDIKPAFAEPEC